MFSRHPAEPGREGQGDSTLYWACMRARTVGSSGVAAASRGMRPQVVMIAMLQ